ncbi:MAG TPA: hypothetical protein VFV11_05005 [Solimonas sp.]|nr:hypothetical protein [Solimonas sp.]
MKKTIQQCLLLTVLAMAGCATYQPAGPRTEQTAILALHPPGGMRQISFKEVDGKPLTLASALGLTRARAPVILAPGKHTVRVHFRAGFPLEGSAKLWLVAEPGGSYLVHCDSAGYRFRCWIEDSRSGRPVGGFVGSGDEPGT